jgi:cyclopropane-fatty-acyl-phospholipid synthase
MSVPFLGRAIVLVERGLVPDLLVRWGIRRLNAQRLREVQRDAPESALRAFVETAQTGPVATVPHKANEQHYELPPAFFERVLGRHLKYSGCLFAHGATSLDEAEADMLDLTTQRAQIADGMSVLELGCGWGSLTLFLAQRFPGSQVTGVSNSRPQRDFIMNRAASLGLTNVRIITADMNDFGPDQRYDRVVSVEMFEHMRNHAELLRRIAGWLAPDGKLFVHVFAHRDYAYTFETEGDDNWMGRYFFTGGIMPSHDLLPCFQQHVALESSWRIDGSHYARTAEAWLANLDHHRTEILPILAETYGIAESSRWLVRWRLFFLACAELFAHGGGTEWGVSHYLFQRRNS